MIDQHAEIEALRAHFEARGLDIADSLSVASTLIGIHVGLAADDEAGAKKRVEIISSWMLDSALRIVRSLKGGGHRVQ